MTVQTRTVSLGIEGMTCPGCEAHVQARLGAVEGVVNVDVRYGEARAVVDVIPTLESDALPRALEGTVYSATVIGSNGSGKPHGDIGSDRDSDADYAIAVIGGGSAGFAAAIRAVEKHATVVMINSGTIGGTCVNVGCVPSKTLIRAAEAVHTTAAHPFEGVERRVPGIDWAKIREGKDELVAALRGSKYEDVLSAYPEITWISAHATLGGAGAVRLDDGRTIRARAVLLATGSSPWAPDIPGLADAGYLDSTALLDIERLPESLIVLGAGSVGLELAQAYSRLGVTVTVLARSRLLSDQDPEVSAELEKHLSAEGITVHRDVRVALVEPASDGRRVRFSTPTLGEGTVTAAEILVASGRRANTTGLGLEHAGIKTGVKGEILVDASQRTSNPRVFAAGDVTGGPMHVYVAAKAGQVAVDAALGGAVELDLTVLPEVTFTDPAVAAVGLTEERARRAGYDPISSKLPLDQVPRALAARDTRGFVKLVAEKKSRRILGAQIVAPEAGEMIMEPAMAIRFGLTIDDLTSMLHPYLTHAEAIKLAALTFDKDVKQLSCCAV